jgi:hypothetical protein
MEEALVLKAEDFKAGRIVNSRRWEALASGDSASSSFSLMTRNVETGEGEE